MWSQHGTARDNNHTFKKKKKKKKKKKIFCTTLKKAQTEAVFIFESSLRSQYPSRLSSSCKMPFVQRDVQVTLKERRELGNSLLPSSCVLVVLSRTLMGFLRSF
jgi:hypothetical protein